MESNRKCTDEELRLIEFLASKADYHLDDDWKEHVWAHPLTGDAIGSIGILMNKNDCYKSKCSHVVSDCTFHDSDNMDVVAYLLADSEDNLYELDLWKCDYSMINKIPNKSFG